MKRNVKLAKALTLSAAALLAPSLLGCQDTLVEEKADAKNRWLELRSSMMLDMAKQQFRTGDLVQARKTVKDAMVIDQSNPDLHVLAGRIEMEEGKLERAYHLLNGALSLEPEHAEAAYYQGLVLQRWQRYDDSLGFYEKAYENDSDNPSYLLAVSETLVELDRVDEAIELLESKRQYFDQNAGVRAAIAHLYTLRGEHTLAARYFQEALLLEPDNTRMQEELAFSLAAAGENQEAIDVFEHILSEPKNKDRVDIKRTLAAAYIKVGKTKQAYNLLQEVSRSPRADIADWVKLGELAYQQDNLGAALQAAGKVMKLAPNRYEGYLLAGMVWQKREHLNNALQMFDRAAQVAPGSTEPLILRGLSLQKAGRLSAAAKAYEDALKRQPQDARALKLLAAVQNHDG